ncbi:MAG: nitrophenyl compound nitroreductase subunit ArsF family protein [Bacteroidota bacterium]
MNSSQIKSIKTLLAITAMLLFGACTNSATDSDKPLNGDSVNQKQKDSLTAITTTKDTQNAENKKQDATITKAGLPVVTIYNFHVTNRCAACIAIEEATTKTLNTYFAKEFSQGRIKRYILNVDDDANNEVSEKYEIFGSGIVVARVFKGKELTTDLTGDGFKYAKNKEEKFIEILKNKITEYLK